MKCICGNMMMQSSMQQWSWFCVSMPQSPSCGRIKDINQLKKLSKDELIYTLLQYWRI